ncbi:RNA-guided endonuclease IscB [Dactylococcopsis salina]|uniref:Restriction endonuclease n=1 Tax=Dactylococcopsis salina (strain PCC 8305) TaxID=13035 RepID=K9YX46_DACS8|nr:RNA-guided endonuclease IscB [Dactylococcopsis salina]AFZ51082.1 restriction endonuclease [Dactylococcopsis salina PCC 8305]
MYVFVLDKNSQPLDPTHPAKARKLLKAGRAKVFRRYPFTIIMQDLEVRNVLTFAPAPHCPRLNPIQAGSGVQNCVTHKHQLKIDPGSKTTGLAILKNNQVLWGAELTHRGSQIRDALTSRRAIRRSRRNRKTRYRKPRFLNRKRPEGWLPPSLQSRVDNTMTWVNRLTKICPITGLSQELVRFDLQKLENPEISCIQYQQGELQGYEVREYLLEKWGRQCVYCSVKDVPLEIEHIKPKSKGGSNRISNLTLACNECNQDKGNQEIEDFLSGKPNLLKRIQSKTKKPLADATAVNTTRWKLYESLQQTGLPVETGSGGLTKFNRIQRGVSKTHWLDAACVGKSTPNPLYVKTQSILSIQANGHGCRQMIQMNKYGFPRKGYKPKNPPRDWRTGDIVHVREGKNKGIRSARIKTVRAKGSFDLRVNGKVVSVSRKHIQSVFKRDGYDYKVNKSQFLSSK